MRRSWKFLQGALRLYSVFCFFGKGITETLFRIFWKKWKYSRNVDRRYGCQVFHPFFFRTRTTDLQLEIVMTSSYFELILFNSPMQLLSKPEVKQCLDQNTNAHRYFISIDQLSVHLSLYFHLHVEYILIVYPYIFSHIYLSSDESFDNLRKTQNSYQNVAKTFFHNCMHTCILRNSSVHAIYLKEH